MFYIPVIYDSNLNIFIINSINKNVWFAFHCEINPENLLFRDKDQLLSKSKKWEANLNSKKSLKIYDNHKYF
jgi:hypothetical protein